MNWQNTLTAALPVAALRIEVPTPAANPLADMIAGLREAALRFDQRTDSFAAGKGDTCRDIANKLMAFGSFASDKQENFARSLIEWSKPRVTAPAAPVAAPVVVTYPQLFAVMQKHSTFHVGQYRITRRNQDSLCWIVVKGAVQPNGTIGKLDDGGAVSLFDRRIASNGVAKAELLALLAELEADPLAAAQKYGKLSGRCCSCGRDLTDPDSIELGIGPICARKFN